MTKNTTTETTFSLLDEGEDGAIFAGAGDVSGTTVSSSEATGEVWPLSVEGSWITFSKGPCEFSVEAMKAYWCLQTERQTFLLFEN